MRSFRTNLRDPEHSADLETSFLLALNLGLLLLGMIIDSYAAIVPLRPSSAGRRCYNIHPIHFGMIFWRTFSWGP